MGGGCSLQNYLLGIDVGTGSIKVAVIDEQTKVVAIEMREYEIIREKDDWAQIDTKCLWESFLTCLRHIFFNKKVDATKIKGIGISCLCPGLTALDENKNVLINPIIYTDRRSVKEAEYIKKVVGEDELFKITANNVMAGAISGTSMLWIKNHLPDVYEKTKYFAHVNTLIGVLLTGEVAIDYSNASYTALFETAGSRAWSSQLCEKIGIDRTKLPPLRKSTDVIGGLITKELIDLGIREGTPVVIGGADTPCASITCGVTDHGDASESAGTTNVLTICTEKPHFDKGFINRCHVVDDKWIYQGAMSNTGSSLRWAREELCIDLKEKAEERGVDPYDLMNKEAADSPAGAGGIVFLPYMAGERCPIWDPHSKGVFFGVTLKSQRKDLIRAIMEGCGYGMKQLCEIAQRVTGTEYKEFVSVGGGSKSEVWSQIKANITGKKIIILDVSEAAVIGAALLAGVGTGIYKDIYEAVGRVERKVSKVIEPQHVDDAAYEKGYLTYTELYPRIKDLYRL